MDDVATRLARTIAITWTTEAMIGLRIGHHQDRQQVPTGNGYFGGLAHREMEGARFIGLAIGYSIDVATKYKRPRLEFE